MKRCETHPDYKGVYRPRVLCSDCWRIYTGRQFAEKVQNLASASGDPNGLFADCQTISRDEVLGLLRLED